MNTNHYVAIMAGGVGSRFWPASTEEHPKQFLDILGNGKSLLRMTFERFLPLISKENILIVTNRRYKSLCIEHLPELPESNILCEPSRNNTGPCVAYTALHLYAKNPEASFVVAPSDHIISKEDIFLDKISQALEYVRDNNAIVTLGIAPTRPDTGYGYIETQSPLSKGINAVISFREKPDLDTSLEYLEKGNYLWNGGIFVWKAKDVLESFRKNAPKIIEVLDEYNSCWGTSKEQDYIDDVYPNTPNISVDYAILEKASNVYTMPVDMGWSDLGTWASLYDYLERDNSGNVIQVGANAHINAEKSFIRTSGYKNVVIRGLDNFIVVANQDNLLIYPKDKEQYLKKDLSKLN